MRRNSQETADLVTFTEEILNGKLHFLCSEKSMNDSQLRKDSITSFDASFDTMLYLDIELIPVRPFFLPTDRP